MENMAGIALKRNPRVWIHFSRPSRSVRISSELFLAGGAEAGKIKPLSFCMVNWQFCRFPRRNAARNFANGIKSVASQQTRGNG